MPDILTYVFAQCFSFFWSTMRWPKNQKEARKPSSGELPPQITKNNHNNERDHQEGRQQQEQQQHQTTTQTYNVRNHPWVWSIPLGSSAIFSRRATSPYVCSSSLSTQQSWRSGQMVKLNTRLQLLSPKYIISNVIIMIKNQ